MSKLIHISAPHSSTDEERKTEEKRVQRMFPGAGVVCLLEGWRIEVHDIPSQKQSELLIQAIDIPCGMSAEQVQSVVKQAIEDAAESIGSLA